MTDRAFSIAKAQQGEYVVRTPRLGDAIGQSLKGIYTVGSLPADMQRLICKLDRVTTH